VLECKLEQFSKEAAGVTAVIGSIEAACVDIIKSFSSEKLESTDLLQDAVRKSIFDKIQNEITSSAGKAAVADDTVKNLNSEIDRLKESTLVSNKTLSGINAEKEELNSTLATVRQALETCKEELASSKLEKDSQMLVIANMITEKGKADVELESASQQNQELTQRCEDLRKMNDEIMSMLEKMYDKKEES
jgi:chromosome segregation ATPase